MSPAEWDRRIIKSRRLFAERRRVGDAQSVAGAETELALLKQLLALDIVPEAMRAKVQNLIVRNG
ncbi:MAG: hypothetical protein H6873_05730 [Hyphomicrobiaceae bacterium]|nr:hypothetical protein [Hyphomicrobiaceae bacterium]